MLSSNILTSLRDNLHLFLEIKVNEFKLTFGELVLETLNFNLDLIWSKIISQMEKLAKSGVSVSYFDFWEFLTISEKIFV